MLTIVKENYINRLLSHLIKNMFLPENNLNNYICDDNIGYISEEGILNSNIDYRKTQISNGCDINTEVINYIESDAVGKLVCPVKNDPLCDECYSQESFDDNNGPGCVG